MFMTFSKAVPSEVFEALYFQHLQQVLDGLKICEVRETCSSCCTCLCAQSVREKKISLSRPLIQTDPGDYSVAIIIPGFISISHRFTWILFGF